MRVLVGCFFLEANSFARGHTMLDQFAVAGLRFGDELRREHLPAGHELASAWDVLLTAGIDIVPGVYAWSPPGPMLAADAFQRIADELTAQVDGSLDGVYLQLHGSALADGIDDPEGVLLRAVRDRLRPGVPIAISLDLHATMTPAMAAAADIVTAYRTCPHVDLARTGSQAAHILVTAIRGRVKPVLRTFQLPMTTPPARHDNDFPPFTALMDACTAAEAMPGVLSAAVLPSQPWVDVADLGWSTVVTADGDAALASGVARILPHSPGAVAMRSWVHGFLQSKWPSSRLLPEPRRSSWRTPATPRMAARQANPPSSCGRPSVTSTGAST